MRPVPRQKSSRLHPFEVVLHACPTGEPQVLHTACDANRATLAFHEQLQHLRAQQLGGALLLVQHAEESRTLLRQPLG